MIHVVKHAENFISLIKCCNTVNLHIHTERVAQQHFACKLSSLKKIELKKVKCKSLLGKIMERNRHAKT